MHQFTFSLTDPNLTVHILLALGHNTETRKLSVLTLNSALRHSMKIKAFNPTYRGTAARYVITNNVPLFKKLRDIIFFLWENHFISHFEGHFEGAKTFLTP